MKKNLLIILIWGNTVGSMLVAWLGRLLIFLYDLLRSNNVLIVFFLHYHLSPLSLLPPSCNHTVVHEPFSFLLHPSTPSPPLMLAVSLLSTSLSLFCLLVQLFIRFLMRMTSYGVCLCLPGLFHLA